MPTLKISKTLRDIAQPSCESESSSAPGPLPGPRGRKSRCPALAQIAGSDLRQSNMERLSTNRQRATCLLATVGRSIASRTGAVGARIVVAPASRARHLSTPQSAKLLALMLIRTLVRTWSHCGGETHALRVLLASLTAGVRFRVAAHGLLGRSAALRDRHDLAFEVDGATTEAHQIPRAHAVGGAYSRAVDMHFAATHRPAGERSGLEEAHAEEPAIDAGGTHGLRKPACRP